MRKSRKRTTRRVVRRPTAAVMKRKRLMLMDSPRRKNTFKRDYLNRTLIRETPNFRRRPVSKIIVQQRIIPRKPRVTRGILRLELRSTECKRRKKYKKSMMKKLAAQAGAGGKLSSWRKTLDKTPNISYKC